MRAKERVLRRPASPHTSCARQPAPPLEHNSAMAHRSIIDGFWPSLARGFAQMGFRSGLAIRRKSRL